MNVFALLEGISPWWWVAFALMLGALEMVSMAFFLIGPALAALVMSILLVLMPGMPGTVQVAMFAAISVALTFVFQRFRHTIQTDKVPHGLNDRTAQMIGRQG
ncbi:MAG: NfeD family protein, partial [Pseudomonadota bacterium]